MCVCRLKTTQKQSIFHHYFPALLPSQKQSIEKPLIFRRIFVRRDHKFEHFTRTKKNLTKTEDISIMPTSINDSEQTDFFQQQQQKISIKPANNKSHTFNSTHH